MRKINIDLKKMAGILGAILFSLSIIISHPPHQRVMANGIDDCGVGCDGSAQLCQSHGSSCKVKVTLPDQ